MKKKKKSKSTNIVKEIAKGILKVHHRGFGFLKPEGAETGEEIFIPKQFTLGAVDGDLVEVEVNPIVSEKGPEGRVVKIIKRSRSNVTGTITALVDSKTALAYVPLIGNTQEMVIGLKGKEDLKPGDRISIHILSWGKNGKPSRGEMIDYLGHISDPSCDVDAAMVEYELHKEFPEEVLHEARSFGKSVTTKEIKEREDLRDLECFTIDPDTAKDYDDALSLTLEDGIYHLGVHIADVTHYVKPGSHLDMEAKNRCNSTYFPGFVVPMLPHELSSHLCSLQPDVNRLSVSVLARFDQEANLIDYRITRSTIKSCKRFTYKEAKDVLDGKKKSPYKDTLFLMVDLCHRLKKKRAERGCVEFSVPDLEINVDKNGRPKAVEVIEYDITHQLVEEFMLKANEIVATHLAEEDKPLTYRIHEEPNPENLKDFAARCRMFGFSLSDQPTGEELQKLFDEARKSAYGQFIAVSFIRSMKLATYSVQNVGHYGLGLDHYTHFTSPIRRYIDLIVHRVLFNNLSKTDDLEQIAEHCSEKERLSSRAEGQVTMLKKLRLLKEMQKNEPKTRLEAIITQVKPFGIVFEVSKFLLEGFFPLSAMHDDYYQFDEKRNALIGKKTKALFFAGEKIYVKADHINLITQEVKWQPAFKT